MNITGIINDAGWLNLLTGALAIATVWLALATHRMAKATKEIVALEGQPYLVFKDLLFRFQMPPAGAPPDTPPHIKIGLVFLNPGRVRVRYNVNLVRITFGGHTADNPHFLTTGGIVFPSDQAIYWYPSFPFRGVLKPPIKGVVEFDVLYKTTDKGEERRLKRKLEYGIGSFEPYNCDWLFLEEHDE